MEAISNEKLSYMLPKKNENGLYINEKNEIIQFRFLCIDESYSCPHCGAEGRWVYYWIENGIKRGAMAGCYKKLTGMITKGDREKYFELLADKQAKNKPLNGWDKNVIRMMEFMKDGKYPIEWCNQKIDSILKERTMFLAKKRY